MINYLKIRPFQESNLGDESGIKSTIGLNTSTPTSHTPYRRNLARRTTQHARAAPLTRQCCKKERKKERKKGRNLFDPYQKLQQINFLLG